MVSKTIVKRKIIFETAQDTPLSRLFPSPRWEARFFACLLAPSLHLFVRVSFAFPSPWGSISKLYSLGLVYVYIMGQALSVQSGPGAEDLVFALHQGGPLPELSAISLPLALNNPRKTTVHALGSIQPEIVLWHVAGGRKVWPFPIGYRQGPQDSPIICMFDIFTLHWTAAQTPRPLY